MATSSKEHIQEGVEGKAPVVGKKVYTKEGLMRDREEVPRDMFYLSEAKKREYNIGDDEEPYWARDAAYWSAYEGTDRIEQLQADPSRGGMGARLVYKNGEFDKVRIAGDAGDLVLMAIPKVVKEVFQQEIDDANAEYQKELIATEEGFQSDEDTFDRRDLARRMKAEHEYHKRTGLAGGSSPTAGLSLIQAGNLMKSRGVDVEAKQERLRMGAQHTTVSDEDFASLITGRQLEKAQKRSFSVGDTGIGKTTKERLAARGAK